MGTKRDGWKRRVIPFICEGQEHVDDGFQKSKTSSGSRSTKSPLVEIESTGDSMYHINRRTKNKATTSPIMSKTTTDDDL